MTESEQAMLDSLIARADQAKVLSEQISQLQEYGIGRQREHVEFSWKCSEPDFPAAGSVYAMLELGRQTMLTQLQEELKTVLGVVKPPVNNLREYECTRLPWPDDLQRAALEEELP